MKKYYYCPICKKQINPEEVIRKPMDTVQKIVWAIVIIATFGVGAIVFLIYHFWVKKKRYCPTCNTKLTVSTESFEKEKEDEEPKTAKERVFNKAGKELPKKEKKKGGKKRKEKEQKEIYCPFCGTTLEASTKVCPSCGTSIEDR